MNLGELRAEARILLDDPEMPGAGDPSGAAVDADSLWKNADLNRWFNQAVEEACIRARLLRDSTTPQVCEIATEASVATYPLDGSIYTVERARLDGEKDYLSLEGAAAMDTSYPNWETWDSNTPHFAVCDLDSFKLTLAPTPAVAGTLYLTVYRVPIDCEKMEKKGDDPVIHTMHHQTLVDWVLHRAYSVKDAETQDEKKSTEHLALFERRFGLRPTARELHGFQHQRVRRTAPYYF